MHGTIALESYAFIRGKGFGLLSFIGRWVVVGCNLFCVTAKEEYEDSFVVGSGKLSANFLASVDVSFVGEVLGFDDGSQDREC